MADANVVAVLLSAGGADPGALLGALAFIVLRLTALLGVPAALGFAVGLVVVENVGRTQ